MTELVLSTHNLKVQRDNWFCEFSAEIPKGKVTAIVGPSGGGKSTLLETIAGFIEPSEGNITLHSSKNTPVIINHLPPSKRDIGIMFQRSSLFPHLSIGKNLELALHDRPNPKKEKKQHILETLEEVKLSADYLKRLPSEVSGGELARLNLCRTLLRPFSIFLLDEPFASLDEKLRLEMNALIQRIHRKRSLSTLWITHSQDEALLLSDWIIFISEGQIEFSGSPQQLLATFPTPSLIKYLKNGFLFTTHEGQTFFLKNSDITSNKELCKTFSDPYTIEIEDYRILSINNETRIFSIKHQMIFKVWNEQFHGQLFFDKYQALKIN